MPIHSLPTILLVDDNASARTLTAQILGRAGFDIWEATTGSEAFRLVQRRPDLVILDIHLPDVSGFEVCQRLRADPATASIPVLHLSGVASSSADRTQGLEGGADGYLLKPVDPAELIAYVRTLLRLRRAEDSLRESEERYRLIAENSSVAVFMLDEQSTILFANRAAEKVFGYTAEELRNQNLTQLMAEPLRSRYRAALERYLATGCRSVHWEGMEVLGLHRSGRQIALEVSFGEFRDREGRRRFVGVAKDISARKEVEQALATLSRQLLEVQETERRHLAYELHDEVGQALTVLKIALDAIQRQTPASGTTPLLQDAVGQVDRITQQIRTLAQELRPPMMDDLGLFAALRWHVKRVTERTGLTVQLEVDTALERLPTELEMACFRVVQEALTNAVKHAQARHARVLLRRQAGELDLTIRDDGRGFDVAAARRRGIQGTSLGLLGMEERVLLLGGQFGMESAPAKGTEVRVRFPLGSAASTSEQEEATP